MEVKLITFKTNHTLIAQLDCTDEKIIIKEPVQVIVQPSKDGPMMGFAPFLEYSDEFRTGIKVDPADVLCITTPVRELLNQYNEMFGSGIQIASQMPKL